jgi:hypothetical protein
VRAATTKSTSATDAVAARPTASRRLTDVTADPLIRLVLWSLNATKAQRQRTMTYPYAAVARVAIACTIADSLLFGCGPPDVASEKTEGTQSTLLMQSWEEWHQGMLKTPMPKKGCFQGLHPSTSWTEVPCVTPPPLPRTVGAGADFSAPVASGTIRLAQGSFPSVTGVTSVTDSVYGGNAYTLQLNTNTFSAQWLCTGGANCTGWQQFVFDNQNGVAFIQYWLYADRTIPCPGGWQSLGADKLGRVACIRNSSGVTVSAQPITHLAGLYLTGKAVSGTDTVILSVAGTGDYGISAPDNVLNLENYWTTVEFNVLGEANDSTANFNNGVTIVVRTTVDNGTLAAPVCSMSGLSGETNNLSLVPSSGLVPSSCCPVRWSAGGSPPNVYTSIQFTETNVAGVTPPFCLLDDIIPIESPLL